MHKLLNFYSILELALKIFFTRTYPLLFLISCKDEK